MDWLDGQEFSELCMDYRGASSRNAQGAYEALQQFIREQIEADAYECVSAAYLLDASPQGNA
jgi:hypothetical protein